MELSPDLTPSFQLYGEKTHDVDVLEVLLHAARVQVGTRKGIHKIHLLASCSER